MATNVYDLMREAILNGRLPGGASMNESTLAAAFGSSRTPVREALHRLEIERLVERSARGVRVRDTSPEEILDIYEVRITLEAAAAAAAARRATNLDRIRLRSAHEAMLAPTSDPKLRAELNRKFHEAVWKASHSPTMDDLLRRLNVHLIRYPTTTLTFGDRWSTVLTEHATLLEAIESGDEQWARRVAEDHMAGALAIRLQMYAHTD